MTLPQRQRPTPGISSVPAVVVVVVVDAGAVVGLGRRRGLVVATVASVATVLGGPVADVDDAEAGVEWARPWPASWRRLGAPRRQGGPFPAPMRERVCGDDRSRSTGRSPR